MSTVYIRKSNATINVGSDASYVIIGDDDKILIGDDSTVTAVGSALSIEADSGDVVSVGGNGTWASDLDDNTVRFQGPGTLHELANSRVDATANDTLVTMAGADTLGVYGLGDTVAANGTGDGVWIGQNGDGVTGAARDIVSGLNHGSLFELQDSSVGLSGSFYTATMSGYDALTALGVGVRVDVNGAEDILEIGGNGRSAKNGDDDVVLFQSTGDTMNLFANSRVDANVSYGLINLDGTDTVGVYGAGDRVVAVGKDDGIWIGQNGEGATGAAIDRVNSLTLGTMVELQGSNVAVNGSDYTATMSGQDALLATGMRVVVNAAGAGNVLTIGGNGAGDSDFANFLNPGFVEVLPSSTVEIFGNSVSIAVAGGRDTASSVSLFGAGDRASVAGFSNTITVGQNGAGGAADVVSFVPSGSPNLVNELEGSNVVLNGSSLIVEMEGDDSVTVKGFDETVDDYGGPGGNNHVTIGGDPNSSPLSESVSLLNPGGSVNVLDNSAVSVDNFGAVSNPNDRLTLGANDWVSISGGLDIFVPVATGNDRIDYFTVHDTLTLATHFASVNALLAATTEVNGNAIIALDSHGDSLTLGSLTKDDVATYAQQGIIKFA